MNDPQAQQANKYILDPESPEELARQINMDRIVNKAMGGPLAGLPPLPSQAQILDIGCGAGGWVLDAAFARPDCEVAGIDISRAMVDYANMRARSQGLTNASFGVMDALQPLDFADNTFDLVNGRWWASWLNREDWPKLLHECFRIVKPGGIIRLTESDTYGTTSSAGYETILASVYRAMYQGGYGFSVDGTTIGITPHLRRLLREAGCEQIQYQAHVVDFSAGTEAWNDFYHNVQVAIQEKPGGKKPIPILLGLLTEEEMDALIVQMDREMKQPDFGGLCYLTTYWGIKPA